MRWDDLRFVLAVSQARSFLGAARTLHVTHTTVARRILALEKHLGGLLFLREGNRCVPTPACARIVAAAVRIEEEVRVASKAAFDTPEVVEGPVYLSSVHWIINEILLPAAPALHARYPRIRLRYYGGLHDGPRDGIGKILSLRFELQPGPSDEVVPIGQFGYALYGPAGCGDGAHLPWVSFGGSMQVQWLRRLGINPEDILITVGDATAVIAAVRVGLGKGLIPECLAASDPALERLSGANSEFVRSLRLVGDREELASARGQALVAWLEGAFRDIGCGIGASMA